MPFQVLVPDFEMMLTTPPEALPNSAENELRLIWNSCAASCENVGRTPPETP